jgi:hypothetical protein
MRKLIDSVEHFHNQLSDRDFIWWPFGFLKPRPDQRMGMLLRFKMALLFGAYFVVFYALRRLLFGHEIQLNTFALTALEAVLGFFVWFNCVTAYFWNRRASRHSGNQDP